MMPCTFLTSWKEIAEYLGKSIRTVQRWEHEFGLPVCRPERDASKATVLIEKAALDRWIRSTFNPDETSRTQLNWALLERSKQLIAEAAILREEHCLLVQQSRRARLEMEQSRRTYSQLQVVRLA